ncbi:MAG: ABC transporter permease [Deltaproteobacteria bacterium]|nr:ABC transporter permease [Deltaproteobacteria bacterium]
MLANVRLLVHLGLQSLRAHKTKSLIVGGLMTFGAFLVVVSLALLDSVERATRASIVQSISGDVQLYDAKAKDKLALFGGFGFGTEDLGEIPSYAKIRDAVTGLDNVVGVVPYGIANAGVSSPGDLDRALNALRDAVRAGDMPAAGPLAERVRGIAAVLQAQQEKQASVSQTVTADVKAVLERATSDALWAEFEASPLPVLDWLDTKLAPLGEQGNTFYLRLAGTDLQAFNKTFSRIKIVEGELVPPDTRGVLVGKSFIDRRLKMAVAMNLDTVRTERARGATIAGTKTLQETIGKAVRASPRIVYLLAPRDVAVVAKVIAAEVGQPESTALTVLLREFIGELDDANFDRRYGIFYEVIAPRIQLYPFRVGDTITMTAFTKSGYLRSVNVKVWGIYTIDGLETSDIAGALSLCDLVTFRELYGQRTASLDAELVKMKAASGAAAVERDTAEDALFGGDATVEVKTVEQAAAEPVLEKVDRQADFRFEQGKVNEGMVLSTAVLLKDPSRLRETITELRRVVEPLGLQAATWQEATGVVGQITLVIRGVLLTAIFILFLVTTVILNNSLVMATLERVAEFGTLRAIGAQRGFVNAMVVFETAVLGVLAGVVGSVAAVACVLWLGQVGIPAPADLLQVLFGGPRLYPTVHVDNVVAGLLATLTVSVFATLYPARLATRVQPVVAMQGKE